MLSGDASLTVKVLDVWAVMSDPSGRSFGLAAG